MKRNTMRTALFCITLLLVLATVAPAQVSNCSNANVAGSWVYTYTGTIMLSTGAVPLAAVGKYNVDPAGNFSGSQTRSIGGASAKETLKGTSLTNSDCSGTITVGVYDQSGTLLRNAVIAAAYAENAKELRAIFASVALPNGTALPVVITVEARRINGDE